MDAETTLEFFLGGRDLEMSTIHDIVAELAPGRCHDLRLAWDNARASAYATEIAAALARGRRAVLVELELDLSIDPARVIVVDHHGPASNGRVPGALEQVALLLNIPPQQWPREWALVSANDTGYIEGLLAMGATREEISDVRRRDRAAQGITAEQELAGEEALARATRPHPSLTVVELDHAKTAVVSDRLHCALGGPGFDQLLVLCPHETNFFGRGDLIAKLVALRPGSWCGGDLPLRGFWGMGVREPSLAGQIVAWLERSEDRSS